jgi:hypothetical protein
MYDWARCEEVYGYYGGPNCSGRYTAEFRYPVVCDVLYTLDPSTWRKFSTDEYRVRIFLESVKPDANYDRSTVLFWLER